MYDLKFILKHLIHLKLLPTLYLNKVITILWLFYSIHFITFLTKKSTKMYLHTSFQIKIRINEVAFDWGKSVNFISLHVLHNNIAIKIFFVGYSRFWWVFVTHDSVTLLWLWWRRYFFLRFYCYSFSNNTIKKKINYFCCSFMSLFVGVCNIHSIHSFLNKFCNFIHS